MTRATALVPSLDFEGRVVFITAKAMTPLRQEANELFRDYVKEFSSFKVLMFVKATLVCESCCGTVSIINGKSTNAKFA